MYYFLVFALLFGFAGIARPAVSSPAPALMLQLGNPFSATVWAPAAHVPLLAVGVPVGVQLWDMRTWQLRRTIVIPREDHTQSPLALAIALSPDGKLLAATTSVGNLQLWDTTSGLLRHVIPHAPMMSLRFSSDGKEIVGSGFNDRRQGQTVFWNVQTGQPRLQLPSGGEFALSSDGRRAAVVISANSASDSTVALWDTRTGRRLGTFADRSGVLGPLAFSPDGRQLATVGEDPAWAPPNSGPFGQSVYSHELTLKLWDTTTQKQRLVLPSQGSQFTRGLQWSSDGRFIVSASQPALVYRASDGNLVRSISDLSWASFLSADGRTLLSQYGPGIVSVDFATGLRRISPKTFFSAASVSEASYSPDGATLASGEGGFARLWDSASGTGNRLLSFEPFSHLFFLLLGNMLVLSSGQKIQVWDTDTETVLHTFTNGLPDKMDTMSPDLVKYMAGIDLLLSPDGRTLLRKSGEASARIVEVLDAATSQPKASLTGMEEALRSAIFSPKGDLLANRNDPHSAHVSVWDVRTSRLFYDLPTSDFSSSYIFSPDSKILAVVKNSVLEEPGQPTDIQTQVILYKMADGRPYLRIGMGLGQVSALHFSPNGKLLAISHAGKIKFYETSAGRLISTITSLQEDLKVLAFSPDGTRIVTVGQTDTYDSRNLIRIWNVRDQRLMATLIGLEANEHSSPEWIACLPGGYYAASPSAMQAICFRVRDRLLPAKDCRALYRPDLVQKAMRGF